MSWIAVDKADVLLNASEIVRIWVGVQHVIRAGEELQVWCVFAEIKDLGGYSTTIIAENLSEEEARERFRELMFCLSEGAHVC